jgi:uncharacterized membrane protein YbhN (UPF0104 family)
MLRDFLMAKVIGPMSGKFGFLGSPWFIASMVLVVVIAIVIIRRAGKDHHNQSAFVKKVRGIAHEVGSGFKTILRMKNNGWFLFHTFFIWFLYFLMTWVCFFCLTSTEHLGFDAGMFVLVAGGLGMTAPVQGGIGAYHYVVSQSLQLFGISSTDGIAYATLVHTTQLLTVVGLGILAMIMLSVQRRKKDENKPV